MDIKKIQQIIIKSGLSNRQIGKQANVSHMTVWRIRKGFFEKISKNNIAIVEQWAKKQSGKTILDILKGFFQCKK